jgi:hypothetical protein
MTDEQQITVADIIGTSDEDQFMEFNLTEVQALVSNLQSLGVDDVTQAENLQQQALRCADILAEYIGKLIKTVAFLEAKANSKKNSVALRYEVSGGVKTSIELKKMAGEADPEVEDLQLKIAKAKGAKAVIEKKYDIVIKAHHHYKDMAAGMRKTIV